MKKTKASAINDIYTNNILQSIQQMKEDQLSQRILVPLFNVLGFQKVEYHGGRDEVGKDLIFWETDKLGFPELNVAQVKRYRPTSRANDKSRFSKIVDELRVAGEERVQNIDGKKYVPNKVYFITPFPVNARVLMSRFEKYSELTRRGLRIIDGNGLIELIKKKLPDLANELAGKKIAIQSITLNEKSNKTLLRALDYSNTVSIKSMYSDLEITYGLTSTSFFWGLIDTDLKNKVSIEISPSELKNFLRVLNIVNIYFKATIIDEDVIEKERNKYNSIVNDINRYGEKKSSLKNYKLSFKADITKIISFIKDKKIWLEKKKKLLENIETAPSMRKQILTECYNFFSLFNKYFNNKMFCRLLNAELINSDYLNPHKAFAINCSLSRLLTTKFNFLLLGEAGSGKTTTLEMLAERTSLSSNIDREILFLPLAKVMKIYTRLGNFNNEDQLPSERFKSAIISYYKSEGLNLSLFDLEYILSRKDTILFCDGVDEVVDLAQWIIKSIEELINQYQKIQIVISSRIGGEYISETSFFPICLLPFTKIQRDRFFANWPGLNDQKVQEIINHLNKNPRLDEIIRNPLLATILCVIAENGIRLPTNEIRLYQERMRLLLGVYDIQKSVKRTITPYYILDNVARKIAYYLHRQNLREADLETLKKAATQVLLHEKDNLTNEQINIAVDELVYPCNIIVPMDEENSFGFGHFRYQEFLVAIELNQNRTIPLEPLRNNTWWNGSLYLLELLN